MLKKNKIPLYNENDRMEIINSIKYVDEVFLEESFEQKRDYIKKYNGNILVMGSDWSGKFDEFNDICEIKILDRTENISTTEIVQKIKN
jgi:glycerol-3-phosphate cytidylyltransferase